MHEDHLINRASWEEPAAVHGQDAYYDSEGLVAGRSSLIEEEEAALQLAVGGDVAGSRVLHVQCHLGCDAITFARRGANVTGVDFSTVALSKGTALAERCGVEVEWVCADVTDLPDTLDGRFDLAWATIGVLCWISDVRAWMRSVARTLRSGGSRVLIDGHPGDEGHRGGSLCASARTIHERGADYATPLKTGPQVQFTHCLAGVVSAASAAGLHVTELLEHRSASDGLCNDRWKQESNRWNQESDGRFRRRVDGEAQPLEGGIMGLDGVEILMEVEDAFDLEISDEAASKMFTPGDLIDYVVDHVEPASTQVCASHRAFNLVRRAFGDVLAIRRTDFRRWMPLEHVVPTRERRVTWAEIGESSGAKEWPELTLPMPVFWVLVLVVPASAFAVAIWITGLGVVPDTVGALVALMLMIPLGIVAAWSTRPLRVCFSPSASTVDGLIRFVAAKNPGLVVDDTARWSRERVTLVVRQIIADQLAITEFDEDDRFVEDLGLS